MSRAEFARVVRYALTARGLRLLVGELAIAASLFGAGWLVGALQ